MIRPVMPKRSANKRAHGAGKKAKGKEAQDTNGGHQEEVETFNVFTLDMDTVECEICSLPFDSQIYMCKNGHAACPNCCRSMNRRCSSCTEPIGDFRCRAMEKILDGMTRPCKFRKHGCQEVVRFTELRVHEEACPYAPYSCPFIGCTYDGVLLYDHMLDDHILDATNVEATSGIGTRVTLQKDSPFHALLHRDGKSLFILLNGGDVLGGRSLSMVRVCSRPGPDEEEAEKLRYVMVVRGDEHGSLSLTASGNLRRWEDCQPERFLFVPDAFWGSSGSITVTVYV